MSKEQDALKGRWRELLQELYATLSGVEAHPRSTAAILKDLEAVRKGPEAKGLGLYRPCIWLPEWRAFSTFGADSELGRERLQEWVKLGWIPATPEDERRQRMQAKAEETARELDRQRAEQRAEEEDAYAAQQTPLTRRALEQVRTGVGVVSSKT